MSFMVSSGRVANSLRTCADDHGAAMIVSHDPDFLDLVCTEAQL